MEERVGRIPDTYEIISREYIYEIEAEALLIRHRKTGARVAVLSCDDDNKVFSIGFRTPPKDSTGIAHIMEHSVLCGSEHFPAKDPFVELAKGSLNTFLNAMTYPDKTIYPIASCNDTDFQNLMHVYLDAVFHPNIYIHDEIFRQEGWHYELTDRDAPLTYNGVVYNEMKGAFSSPEEILYRKISDSLYPDTIYSVESGGDPDVIPQLTYEQFLDFHRKYYHPSNSYIYLYGNMDVYEKLDFIDREYLCNYNDLFVDSAIARQEPFEKPVYGRFEYPVGEDEDEENSAYMACSWVIGDSLDPDLYYAFQILEYVLMEAPGAPVKQALLDRGLGEDIYGVYETSMIQPYLSFIIKNIGEESRDEAVSVIRSELERLADGGLSHRTLEGVLNFYEFRSHEGDFGRWPKGLMYGIQMADSWLYDDSKPFIHLKFQKVYDSLRSKLEEGYFEELIRKYLLENTHSSVLLLCPSKGLTARREADLTGSLASYKASLSDDELDELIEKTAQLKEYQSEPSPKEVLEKIPQLTIGDIRKEAEPLYNNRVVLEGTKVLHHNIATNQIAYVSLLFDTSHIKESEVPYLGILAEVFGDMNTENYSYGELADEVNLYTGGLHTDTDVYGERDKDSYLPMFEISGKAMYYRIPKLFELMEEVLLRTRFDDDRRLKDILNQVKSRLEMNFMSNGHTAAVKRAESYFSRGSWYKELTGGIEFYHFICDILKDYDARKDSLIEELGSICKKIFRKEFLLADVTADEAGLEKCSGPIADLSDKLYSGSLMPEDRERIHVGVCPYRNEAFITAGTVQYNACTGNFMDSGIKYSGAMNAVKNILSNEYLWNNVRVKGGAYGCMCGFSISGNAYLTSYRDPNLKETYDIYAGAADYLRNIELDERELTKFIIGAVGAMDAPMTPSMKGSRSLAAYLNGRSYDQIQKNRDELLCATVESIREQADAVEAVVNADCICVVGSESSIMAEKDRFEHISELIR